MREAHNLWVKTNQVYLTKDSEYKQIEIQFNCKVDSNGLTRCYGRMKYANIPENAKAPIMLSKEHRLSVLVVLYCHLRVMHRGLKQTLNEIRANYWITRGRSFVKKVISPCVLCRKLNGRPFVYPGHSDLPELRYDDRFPFASTGCDYLGPLFVQSICCFIYVCCYSRSDLGCRELKQYEKRYSKFPKIHVEKGVSSFNDLR